MQKDNDLPARGRSDCRQTPNKTRGLSLFYVFFPYISKRRAVVAPVLVSSILHCSPL